MHLFVNNMTDPDIADYKFDDDDLSMMPIIIPQFHLQAEFPALDFEDSGGKDITGTDVESENQEADREAQHTTSFLFR